MTFRHAIRIAFALAALVPAAAFAQTDLIISEYVEGTSNNKSIELFNPTGSPIDMTAGGYKLRLFSNGSATVSAEMNLIGTVPSGGRWVVSHASAAAGILAVSNQTSSTVINYNGDDAVVLTKGGAANTTVDAFGQVGFDPGTEWGTGLQSTADNTLRRGSLVCDGDTNASDAFDPAIQWVGFATDTFDGLGQHSVGCGPTPARTSSWGAIKTLYR